MAIFPLKHAGSEYVFHFGEHDIIPKGSDKLNASKLDALVLEENLEGKPQAQALVQEMRSLGKPVYYVENRALHERAASRTSLKTSLATSASIAALISFLDNYKHKKFTRGGFLAAMAAFVGVGKLTISDLGRAIPQDQYLGRIEKAISRSDLEKLPRDVKGGILLAKRNAVTAEGLVRLSGIHKKIGVLVGADHYNVPFYVLDDKLRSEERGKIEPEIRMLK